MSKDICTVSVVTFHPVWGDKETNLKRILKKNKEKRYCGI